MITDSINALDLTINNSDNTSSSVIACDGLLGMVKPIPRVVSILTTTLTLMVCDTLPINILLTLLLEMELIVKYIADELLGLFDTYTEMTT